MAETIQGDIGGSPLGATLRDFDASSTRSDSDSSSETLDAALLGKIRLAPTGSALDNRYSITGMVGKGATSQVFDAIDNTFDRHIAIKFMRGEKAIDAKRIARFMREAKVTARLEHPNIAPIHDMDFTADGGIYFTMRMITGTSLGDALRAAAQGSPPPQIADIYQRINIFLRVAEALACAHARRILHSDIKPDNIMLGAFGEVMLVDWGSALMLDEDGPRRDKVVGTPNYMSPEQARAEPIDERSDIYCLGASLYQSLTFHLPTTGINEAEFWDKKRRGVLDQPIEADSARIPRRLLAIARKAMAAEAHERYASVAQFAADLSRYQAGLAISAYRDTPFERLARWHRLNARMIWGLAALLVIVTGATAVVYGERLKEIASWGQAIVSEDFSDDTQWQRDWRAAVGSFAVHDGMLVSAASGASMTYYRRRLDGDVAIEYDGRMLPDSPPCDLSVLYAIDDPFTPRPPIGAADLRRFWILQVGAFDNSYVQIVREPISIRYDTNPFQLEPGRTYRIRVEIEGGALRILVDGRVMCEHHEPVPLTSGWIGLYGYYAGKAFDNVRIYSKGMPEKVSALAIGDRDFSDGLFDRAAAHYQRVAEVHAGKDIGDEAAYKVGLAQRMAGRGGDAYATWASIGPQRWRNRVEFHRLEDRLATADFAAVTSGIAALVDRDPGLRLSLRTLWIRAINQARFRYIAGHPPLETLLTLRESTFSGDGGIDEASALALRDLGRYEELLDRYPDQVAVCADVLRSLGRQQDVLTRYPTRRYDVAWSLIEMGRFEEALAIRPTMFWVAEIVQERRVLEERWHDPVSVLDHPKSPWFEKAFALVLLDRHEEVLALAEGLSDPLVVQALLFSRRWDDVPHFSGGYFGRSLAAYHRACIDLAEGREDEARRLLAAIDIGPAWHREGMLWFAHDFFAPFVAARGDSNAFLASLEAIEGRRYDLEQRPWYVARFLAGRLSEEEFLRQPCRDFAPVILALARPLRAELLGDRAAAIIGYRAFLALPPDQRVFQALTRDPIAEAFAAWRLGDLENALSQ